MKTTLKRIARALGLHIAKANSVPFGVDPFADIASLFPTVETAFDVGANIGQTVRKMRRAFPGASIYSFEPVPSTFAMLVKNTARDRRVECLPFGLGDSEGEAVITAGEISGQNTFNVAAKLGAKTATVPVTTIDTLALAREISEIDILKIDTEGYEVPVLRGARKMLENHRVKFVLAECDFDANATQPHGNFFEIVSFLAPLGFRVVAFYCGGVDGNGWVWGDVLFTSLRIDAPVKCSPFG